MLCTLPWPALTRFGPTFSRTSRGGKTGQQAFLWLFLFCPFICLAICELIPYKSNHYPPPPPPPPYCPIHLSLLLSFHLLVSPSCCASLHSDNQTCILPCVCPVNVLDLIQKHFGYGQLGHLIQFCSSYKGPDHTVQDPACN